MSTARIQVDRSDVGVGLHARMLQAAWLPFAGMLIGAAALGHSVPTWVTMWLMLFAIVGCSKVLTLSRAVDRLGRVNVGRAVAYVFAWPGMDSLSFLDSCATATRPVPREWLEASIKTTVGVCLIWTVARLESSVPAAGWIGLVGLAFLLHFGLFHLLALAWRSMGIRAVHIFRAPALAHSVSDLWGSRWNLAFRDVAHALVYRPLVARTGALGASLATFIISGLVHELVISLPARGGYGLPTLYFVLQWFGIVVERSRAGARIGLRRGLMGWLFTLVVVVGPVSLLFHRPFVMEVITPFLKAIGAC